MNKRKRSPDETPAGPNTHNSNASPVAAELNESLPAISRKITACAACRKQKVRFADKLLLKWVLMNGRLGVICQMAFRRVHGVVVASCRVC